MVHFIGNNAVAQEQYAAMWAAYYAQYYNQAPQSQAESANGGDSTFSQDQQSSEESSFHQWIEYYKAYGMTKEMEMMEERLKEYRNSKKVRRFS